MIITNNCLGGYIYTKNSKKYDNPFIWCRLYVKSFIKLMTDFEEIDFDDVMVIPNDDLKNIYTYIGIHEFSISLKNGIRALFEHVKYDENAENPYIKKFNEFTGNVYSKYPYKIVYENYIRRLGRMNKNDKKLFIFMNDAPQYDSKNDLLNLIKTAEERKIHLLFFTEDSTYKADYKYVKIIVCPKTEFSQLKIIEKYNGMFMTFL